MEARRDVGPAEERRTTSRGPFAAASAAAGVVVVAVGRWRTWPEAGFGRAPVSPSLATHGPTWRLEYADLSLESVLDDVEKPACLVKRSVEGADVAASLWRADCLAVTLREKASSATVV